jgi:hypothetical protein
MIKMKRIGKKERARKRERRMALNQIERISRKNDKMKKGTKNSINTRKDCERATTFPGSRKRRNMKASEKNERRKKNRKAKKEGVRAEDMDFYEKIKELKLNREAFYKENVKKAQMIEDKKERTRVIIEIVERGRGNQYREVLQSLVIQQIRRRNAAFSPAGPLISYEWLISHEAWNKLMHSVNGNISIQQLVNSSPLDNFDFEPRIFDDDDLDQLDYDIFYDGSILTITGLDGIGAPTSLQKRIDVTNPGELDELIKIRHEIVSSMASGETDVPMYIIAGEIEPDSSKIWHKLTPDYFCEPTKTIGELGTSMAQEEKALIKTFNIKVEKYKHYMNEAGVNRYYVFIVSMTKVISNYPLTRAHVRTLCSRMRMGVSLEAAIEERMGRSPFKDKEANRSTQRIMALLHEMNSKQRPQFHDFNDELAFIGKEDMSDSELNEASSKLNRIWILSRIARKKTGIEAMEKWNREHSDDRSIKATKRLFPFPIIIQRLNDEDCSQVPESGDFMRLPDGLKQVWMAAASERTMTPFIDVEEDLILEELNAPESIKDRHKNRRLNTFQPFPFNEAAKTYNAKAGLFSKNYTNQEVEGHKRESKMSISMDSLTNDIEEFVYGPSLTSYIPGLYVPESNDLLIRAKQISEGCSPPLSSIDVYMNFIQSCGVSAVGNFVTDMMFELSMCIKVFNSGDSFTTKRMSKHKCWLVTHNTGSLMIFSLCYYTPKSQNVSSFELGPKTFRCGLFTISDWCTITKSQVDHYLKAQPSFEMCIAHQLSQDEVDLTQDIWPQVRANKFFWPKVKLMMLHFLVNKRDAEACISTTRYFYMNLLDLKGKDPMKHVQNFPDVIRSRFTVWIIKKLQKQMVRYMDEDVKLKQSDGKFYYSNLIDWRTNDEFTLEQAVDSFYHGYLSSKDREGNAHTSFKICNKLFKEEYKYREMIESGGLPIMDIDTPTPHVSDRILTKFFCTMFRKVCLSRIGKDYKQVIYKSFVEKLRRFTFNDASTLKATARVGIEESDISVLDNDNNESFSKLTEDMKKSSPKLFEPRKRVIEGLNGVVEEFAMVKGRYPEVYADLVPYCLDGLEIKGGFSSDLFAKSQHEKDREVHVLEVKARVVQSAIEMLSRTLCEFFTSETITHPDQKLKFVKNHYHQATMTFQKFLTLCKSADASTWCQGHHTVRFAASIIAVTPETLHTFVYRILALWVNKKVTLPSSLVVDFIANRKLDLAPDTWIRMRDEMLTRTGPFLDMPLATANIRGGMFQGILHYTSSFYHTYIDEVMKDLEKVIFEKETGSKMIVEKVRGSDDSTSMNSFPITVGFKNDLEVAADIMSYKELVSSYMSITNSRKSVECVPFTVEYNSEWFLKDKSIKPTFRWVAACSTLTVNETFINRYREFNNLLTSVLESGGSTFLSSLIQLSQATFHYKLMGSNNKTLFELFKNRMMKFPDPTLGFMPLSPDLACGALGFDYDLYRVASQTKFGPALVTLVETTEDSGLIQYEGMVDERKRKIMRDGGKFAFAEKSIWQSTVRRMGLQSKDELIEAIEDDPEIVFGMYHDWEHQKVSIALKMYSSGVRSSLGGHSPLFKMACASNFMLNRKFIKRTTSNTSESLLVILRELHLQLESLTFTEEEAQESLRTCFPLLPQYKDYDREISEAYRSMVVLEANMRHRSRVVITVFDTPIPGNFSLMELCKRKWFGKRYNLPLGDTSFKAVWEEAKLNFPFVKDTLDETKAYLGMKTLQLKVLLESVYHKTRKLKLQDTQGRGGSTFSTLMRVYWPKTRVTCLTSSEGYGMDILLSNMFILCAGPFQKWWQSEQARIMLTNSFFLDDVQSNGSVSHKLKIMKMACDGKEPALILEQIRSSRLGVLGFFNVRQKRVGKWYTGYGEWIGMIGSTSVKIILNNEKVERITLNSLSDPDFIARSLFTLLKELGGMTFAPTPSNCGVVLSATGKLRSGVILNDGIGITYDKDLQFTILETMAKSEIKLECSDFGLRLVSINDLGHSVTVLSATMKSSYWIQECKTLVLDKMFEHVHSDTPLLFKDVLSNMPLTRNRQERGHLDGRKFKKMFEREMGIYDDIKEEEIIELDENDANLRMTITDEELKLFMAKLDENSSLLTTQAHRWGDIDEGESLVDWSLMAGDTFSDDEIKIKHSCGMPSRLRLLSIELSYRSSESTQTLARDILIDGRTDLRVETSVADLWTFISGKNILSLNRDVQDPPPSLSKITSAISESDLVNNINLLQNSAFEDVYAMRDTMLEYNKKLLEAMKRRDGKMTQPDAFLARFKGMMGFKNSLRFLNTVNEALKEIGGKKIALDDLLAILKGDESWGMDSFESLSASLSSVVHLILDEEKVMEVDMRGAEEKEDDPDPMQYFELLLDKKDFTLRFMTMGRTNWSSRTA